jgi:imidazoleglycerol-phosphate dehydratase/histidinol-phosphatase
LSVPVLFVDRDGTLIVEPPDEQVDALAKVRLADGVVPALVELAGRGYRLVMVTNQDGLGGPGYPREGWDEVETWLEDLLASQGIRFDAVLVCPHRAGEGCACRKPSTRLVDDWLRAGGTELDRARSAVAGDRDCDLELAGALGLRGFRVAARGDAELGWSRVARRILAGDRRAERRRRTRETEVTVAIDLAADGPVEIATGLGFFDHMLEQLATHGGFAAAITARGDLEVDEHHTVEDVALALGEALRAALGTKRGIARYGFTAAMDESAATVALDLSGRPLARFRGRFARERVGELPTELVPHFFRSLATGLGAALHVTVRGDNDHHRIEACFKAVGRALRQTVRLEGSALPSTKGML